MSSLFRQIFGGITRLGQGFQSLMKSSSKPVVSRKYSMAAESLRKTIQDVITLAKYAPKFKGKYWCLVAAWDILDRMGRDVRKIVENKGIYYTTVEEMVEFALRNCRQVAEDVAQEYANEGEPVLIAAKGLWMMDKGKKVFKSGHVAIAAPTLEDFKPDRGVYMGQTGSRVGFFWRKDIFGPPFNYTEPPRFFILPKREGIV